MKLHLLRTEPLVQELARHAVSGEQQAHYVIASLLFYFLIYYSGLFAASSLPLSLPSLLEFIDSWVTGRKVSRKAKTENPRPGSLCRRLRTLGRRSDGRPPGSESRRAFFGIEGGPLANNSSESFIES